MDTMIVPLAILKDNYVWIIINKTQKCAIIIDPGEAKPIKDFLHRYQLTLRGILITHHHWDHTNGLADLINDYAVPVFGFIGSNIVYITDRVSENDIFKINDFFPPFQVIEIPGHTLDHIAYYSLDALFCGDTLFAGGCGRLFEGTAQQLYSSLLKLRALPDNTKIYCAHEYTLSNLKFASIAEPNNQKIMERIQSIKGLREKNIPSLPSILSEEKSTNPFLRCHTAEIIKAVSQYIGHPLHHPVEVFSGLRQWKNEVG